LLLLLLLLRRRRLFVLFLEAMVGESQALLRMPALGARLRHLGVLVKDTELQNTLVCQVGRLGA
jgi:hypothetical protein